MATISKKTHMNSQTRQLAVHSNWSEMPASEHFVQFYEKDAFLLDSLSGFVSTGLAAGDACIVIATKALRERLEEQLKAKGFDLIAAHRRDEYLSLDAVETLSKFMVDGLPEPERFAEVVGSVLVRAAKSQRHVRIFGDMVAQLWTEGNQAAAIRLEELWNDLHHKTHPFSLFCAYSMHGFDGEAHGVPFTEICKQHSRVIPGESYTALASPDERLYAITLLQQKANSLEGEIAERKRAEERLRISENRYRRLFEESKDGILMVDPRTGKITDANPAMTGLLGCTREQLLAQELWQTGLFEDREATLEALRELQEKEYLCYATLPLHTKDGQRREVEFVSTLYQVDGHAIIQCNIRDITERKQAEEEHSRLAALVESSNDAIVGKTLDGIITSWNQAAERLFGYSASEAVGKPITIIIPPTLYQEEEDIIGKLRQGIRIQHYETVRLRKDGTLIDVSLSISPVKDSTGKVIGAAKIARDITERRELDQRKDEFISMASHELKTPITALKGFTQLLHRRFKRRGDEESLHFLARIDTQLNKLTKLISDLLDISKMQTGQLEYRMEVFDLDVLAQEVVENVQGTTQTHRLVLEKTAGIHILGDRDRMGQVLINLLTNAIKYSPDADRVIMQVAADGENALVSVQDFGIGIAEAYQEKIFERFYQVSEPEEKTYPGLGIGLYIVRQIIKRHQGHLCVQSRKGEGSIFSFSVPLVHA
jgi:PAS domain S-box-containing protein